MNERSYSILECPSGTLLYDSDQQIIRTMWSEGTIKFTDDPFTLRGGGKSHFYFSGREDVTDNPELLRALGIRVRKTVAHYLTLGDQQPCLIPIPTAATAIAVAASLSSVEHRTTLMAVPFCDNQHHDYHPLLVRIMREGLKEHGINRGWVNGKPSPKHTYWLFDNVVTEGGSIFDALAKLEEDGYGEDGGDGSRLFRQMPILVLVDREQGGFNTLRAQGFERLYSCYKLRDIVFALVAHGSWPRKRIKLLENELQLPVAV